MWGRAMRFLRNNLFVLLFALGWSGMLVSAEKVQRTVRDYRVYLEHDYRAKERSAEELQKQPAENLVKVFLAHQDQRKRDAYLAKLAGEAMSDANGGLWLAWLVGTAGFAGILFNTRRRKSRLSPPANVAPNEISAASANEKEAR
jgi:hypothetical protein